MRSLIIRLLVLLGLFFPAFASAAGGGGSGTAAQYFTNRAVGNTWSYKSTDTCTGSQYCSSPTTTTTVDTVTASAGGVVTYQTSSGGNTHTGTMQIDATGAWISTSSGATYTVLPATFSVGTTWVSAPATASAPAISDTIAAFNVTRTVPAGTFTDCLQVNETETYTDSYGNSSTYNATLYLSPTVGKYVDSTGTYVSTVTGQPTTTGTYTSQLQSFTLGNAVLSVAKSGTGSGTITSSPAGIDCGSTCSGSFPTGASVTLSATPSTGSYFSGWSGDCSGAGSCAVTMDAAKNVTATFKPVPFVAATTSTITATSATITTTVAFNAPDLGKQGSVFVTAWIPANGLSALGILAAPMSQAMSVTTTRDNPYTGGWINTRQETLAAFLAAADPNAFVLVQLTTSGWQLVQNGQLIPYASGVLGNLLASQNILNNTDPANLLGAQFCVGYGTSDTEMITAGRMLPVAIIPASNSTATTNGSCNVTDIAVEFYNTNLDNYFITADPIEAAAIDKGSAGPGWSRTGNSFRSGGSTSVCRFYGSYSPGPNSHFYTVDPAECQSLKGQQIPAGDPRKLTEKSWNFESLDFVSTPPTTGGVNGTCPTGTTPVYRAYNNGFSRGVDSNHRITSSQTAIQQVVARGWKNEGVVMCAPN